MYTLLKGLISLILLLSFLVTVLFVDFVYKTFSYSPKEMNPDAVVVLAGGRGRIDEGVRLYRDGKGKQLFLIGVDKSVRLADLYQNDVNQRSSDNVILEKASRNTLENAIFAREILMKHEVRSMFLITSRYHMKRSLLIFRSILPKDIAIYPHPVSASGSEPWWQSGSSVRLLFSEFYKYCLYRIIFIFSQGELRHLASDQPGR